MGDRPEASAADSTQPDVEHSTPAGGQPDGSVAIHQLIRDHHADVYRYAYRLCGDESDAEDLTQQAFLIAHQRLHQIREAGKARSWLFAVLRSVFLKSRRKRTPVSASALELRMEDIPQEVIDEDLDRQRLQMAIGQLPDDYRMVLMLFYFEQCSYKEIAERLEIKLGTVMCRLARAKERLRGQLFAEHANAECRTRNAE